MSSFFLLFHFFFKKYKIKKRRKLKLNNVCGGNIYFLNILSVLAAKNSANLKMFTQAKIKEKHSTTHTQAFLMI